MINQLEKELLIALKHIARNPVYRPSDYGKCKIIEQYIEKLELKQKPAQVTHSNSCNRHSDCAAATEKYKAAHNGETPGFNFHCHDDECEDCFGC